MVQQRNIATLCQFVGIMIGLDQVDMIWAEAMLIHRADSWAQRITSCALQILWLSFFDDSMRDGKWLSFTKYIFQRSTQIDGKHHSKLQWWFLPSLEVKGFETIDSEVGFGPLWNDFVTPLVSSNFGFPHISYVGADNVQPWARTRFCNHILIKWQMI